MMTRLALFLLLTAPLCVHAHNDAYFDTIQGAHGGQLRMAGPFHLEMVAASAELTVYVSDHADAPIAALGGTAEAEITTGGRRVKLLLRHAEGNVLRGTGSFKLQRSSTVRLTLAVPGYPPQQTTFTPLLRRKKPARHERGAPKPSSCWPACRLPRSRRVSAPRTSLSTGARNRCRH
jgi:hypothetical protein